MWGATNFSRITPPLGDTQQTSYHCEKLMKAQGQCSGTPDSTDSGHNSQAGRGIASRPAPRLGQLLFRAHFWQDAEWRHCNWGPTELLYPDRNNIDTGVGTGVPGPTELVRGMCRLFDEYLWLFVPLERVTFVRRMQTSLALFRFFHWCQGQISSHPQRVL
jgi:hypothetical protein